MNRKWVVTITLRSGQTVRFTTRDFGVRTVENCIVALTRDDFADLDYIKLDEIVAITTRRSWRHWSWT